MLRRYRFPVKGSYYYDGARAFSELRLPVGQNLQIKAEPENPHDPNALQIWLPPETPTGSALLLGYIPRQLARIWRPLALEKTDYRLTLSFANAKGRLLRLECECTLQLNWTQHLRTLFWSWWNRRVQSPPYFSRRL